MSVESLAPILVVEAIEPCLPFWTERLGFRMSVQVPHHAEGLGFVLLVKDGVRLMYQSRSSLREDMGTLPPGVFEGSTLLYLRVRGIEAIERALADEEPVVAPRVTPYGAREVGYREPGGHVVVFAQHPS